jgi:prevent-host-death family protein
MEERGVNVDHATLNRWVIRYSPTIAVKAISQKRETNRSWRMDETYLINRWSCSIILFKYLTWHMSIIVANPARINKRLILVKPAVESAMLNKPQFVTKHGHNAVVVLSFEDYKKITKPKIDLECLSIYG